MESWSGGVVEWWSGGVMEWWSHGVMEWWSGGVADLLANRARPPSRSLVVADQKGSLGFMSRGRMTRKAPVRTEPHPTDAARIVSCVLTTVPMLSSGLVSLDHQVSDWCSSVYQRNRAHLCLLGPDFHARLISNHQGCTFPSFGNNGIHYLKPIPFFQCLSCEGILPLYFCGVGFVSYLPKTVHCFAFDSPGYADSCDLVAR
jgi:hypothetical protein